MGAAVQYPHARSHLPYRQTVIFLVQEKACLLAVFHIHHVADPVLRNRKYCLFRHSGTMYIPALFQRQAFFLPQGSLVALIDAADRDPALAKAADQGIVNNRLALFHAVGKHLGRKNIAIPVHRNPRQPVRFTVDQPAGGEILPHNLFPVSQGIFCPPGKEGVIKDLIGIGRQQPDTDPGLLAPETGSQIMILLVHHIHQRPVGDFPGTGCDFRVIYPGMSGPQPGFLLFRHLYSRETSFSSHVPPPLPPAGQERPERLSPRACPPGQPRNGHIEPCRPPRQ